MCVYVCVYAHVWLKGGAQLLEECVAKGSSVRTDTVCGKSWNLCVDSQSLLFLKILFNIAGLLTSLCFKH